MECLGSMISALNVSEENSSGIINFAAKVGDFDTEFVIAPFQNKNLLIVTQFRKISNLYKVEVDQPNTEIDPVTPIYSVKNIFGKDEILAAAAARFIAEKLNIQKPTYIFLDLKNFDKDIVVGVSEAILGKLNNGTS